MPNAKNQASLEMLKEDLANVQAVWVVNYCGLTVKEIQELRCKVREAGSFVKVYKNTIMHRALADLEMGNIDEVLEGPSAFVFAVDDAVAAAKVIKEYAKANKKLEIKGGLMEGQFLTAAEVEAVAALPSKEQLLGQIAGLISGMARGLAVSINGVTSGLARGIAAVAEQKPAA